MTEAEWKLAHELALTKLALFDAQRAFLHVMTERTKDELKVLGPAWVPEEKTDGN